MPGPPMPGPPMPGPPIAGPPMPGPPVGPVSAASWASVVSVKRQPMKPRLSTTKAAMIPCWNREDTFPPRAAARRQG